MWGDICIVGIAIIFVIVFWGATAKNPNDRGMW